MVTAGSNTVNPTWYPGCCTDAPWNSMRKSVNKVIDHKHILCCNPPSSFIMFPQAQESCLKNRTTWLKTKKNLSESFESEHWLLNHWDAHQTSQSVQLLVTTKEAAFETDRTLSERAQPSTNCEKQPGRVSLMFRVVPRFPHNAKDGRIETCPLTFLKKFSIIHKLKALPSCWIFKINREAYATSFGW